MLNVISLRMLIISAALLAWSGVRAWRAQNGLLKWGGAGLAALLTAGVSLTSALMIAGLVKLHTRGAPLPAIEVAGTSEQIQRGQSITSSFCDACHSRAGSLTGGADIAKDISIPIGSLVASNLTPAGQLSRWSDGEIFRAIRNGINAEGHWLIVMSYTSAGKLSDDDIQALVAYIRSRPPAGLDTINPPDRLNPLGVAEVTYAE